MLLNLQLFEINMVLSLILQMKKQRPIGVK